MNTNEHPMPLWTQEQAAAHLGLKNPKTMAKWRLERQGPPYVMVGRCIRYRPEAVQAWLEARTIKPCV